MRPSLESECEDAIRHLLRRIKGGNTQTAQESIAVKEYCEALHNLSEVLSTLYFLENDRMRREIDA